MEVLILNDYDRLSNRVREEVRDLMDAGHSVHVVHFERRGDRISDDGSIRYRETYVRLKAPRGSVRLLVVLPLLYVKLLRTLRHESPDVMHCTHLFLLPITLILAKRKRARTVYDAYEMHALDWSGYVPWGKSIARTIIESLENWMVAKTDCVLTVDSVEGFLEKRYKSVNPNVTVLYNVPRRAVSVDARRVESLEGRYRGRRVLVYVGGAYEEKGLVVMLEALHLIREMFPEVMLLMIGTIDDAGRKAADLIQSRGLDPYLEVIPWLPYERMLEHLHYAEVGLALQQPSGRFFRVSRGNGRKFFTYMQAGLPIVGPEFSQIGQVVREERCGVLVDTTDPDRVADAVKDLFVHREDARAMGRRGRAAFERRYSWEHEKDKLIKAYPLVDSVPI